MRRDQGRKDLELVAYASQGAAKGLEMTYLMLIVLISFPLSTVRLNPQFNKLLLLAESRIYHIDEVSFADILCNNNFALYVFLNKTLYNLNPMIQN